MADIDLGEAKLALSRRNKTEGEGETKKVVGIDYWNVRMVGDNGLVALGRTTPAALEEALGEAVENQVRSRLEKFRVDLEGVFKDAQVNMKDSQTSVNERMRKSFSDLGIGRVTPEPKKTPRKRSES